MYLSHTCPDLDYLFQPPEDAIRKKFIPARTRTGRDPPNDLIHNLHVLSLPPRHGGLWLSNSLFFSESHSKASTTITLPLVTVILGGESNKSACEVHCAHMSVLFKAFVVNCLWLYRSNWAMQVRKVLPVESLSSPFKTQTFISKNPLLGMPCASGMAGNPPSPIHLSTWQVFYCGA